jgi:hypothetical protein
MMDGYSLLLASGLVMAGAAIALGVVRLSRRPASPSIHASIQHMRSIGQLSVFKVVTKEIVTEMDHSWGEFGAKYLSWVLSSKKMAMIFEFDIDFRYDLRSPAFEILTAASGSCTIRMPPCFYEAHIRDIRFYDEQRSRFLPWLLPDLLNGFLLDGFSEADKNKLVDAAKGHAEQQALTLIGNLQSEVQNSAKATLVSISRAFGVNDVQFEFLPQGAIKLHIGVPVKLAA